MPRWAKYDRANGRIVDITEADQAPSEDKTIAVIEVDVSVKAGDFIGGSEAPDDAQEPGQDLTPDAPQVGKPPPTPPGHEGSPPPGHGGTPPGQVGKPPPPGQASKPQPKDK